MCLSAHDFRVRTPSRRCYDDRYVLVLVNVRSGMRRLLLAISCSIIACGPPPEPFELAYTVFPTVEGADVAVRVSGGSQSDAWVAFGVGPGVPASRVTRVHSLSAHRSDGTPLTVTGYRDGGFHIEEIGKGAWTLSRSWGR